MSQFTDHSFANEKVLVRVDFNVPLDDKNNITDDTRIRAAIPTIKKILTDGGKAILMSHLGRPKDGPTDKYSLNHLVPHLRKLLRTPIIFAEDCIGSPAEKAIAKAQPGQVVLLENLRFYKQEEKGDKDFAERLAKLGDVYVNDAFGTAHRAHASTAVIAQFFPRDKRMFGLLMESEVASAEKVLHQAQQPFTAIIGGAKVSDKILIIENLLERATDIIIGGGMAYTFFKATGGKIGNSLCEDDRLGDGKRIARQGRSQGRPDPPSLQLDHRRQIRCECQQLDRAQQQYPRWLDGPRYRHQCLRTVHQCDSSFKDDPLERADGRI